MKQISKIMGNNSVKAQPEVEHCGNTPLSGNDAIWRH